MPPLAQGVAKIGFRKWYERQLLAGHAHMVLAFLAVVALIGSLEAYRGASMEEKLLDDGFVVACTLIGGWALRRYLFLLMRAEHLANQATCPACDDYGRFHVVGVTADAPLKVRCVRCAH